MNILINEQNLKENRCCFTRRENIIYIITNGINLLSCYDINTKHWKILSTLPSQYTTWNAGNILKLFVEESSLYLISEQAQGILVYNLKTNLYKEYCWKIDLINSYIQVGATIKYKDNYIILPLRENIIIKFDPELKRVDKYSEWKQKLVFLLSEKRLTFYNVRRRVCVVSGQIFGIARCEERDVIFSICLESMNLNGIYEVADSGIIWEIQNIGEKIWLQNINEEKSALVIWNPAENKIEREIDISRYDVFKAKIISGKDNIYIYPMQLGRILKITNDIVKIYDSEEKIFSTDIFCDKSMIIAFDEKNKKIEMLDINTEVIIGFSCRSEAVLKLILDISEVKESREATFKKKEIGKLIYSNCKREYDKNEN